MPEYVSPEIPQDPATIRQQMIDDLAADGIEVKPATAMFYLLAVFAFLWAQLAEQASQVFSTIFRYFLQKIVRLARQDAVAAVTAVTFTAKDSSGPYDIPAGTEVNLRGADGGRVPFRTLAPVTIPNGVAAVTPVTVAAATPGTAANGLSALVDLTQTFTWLASVTVLGTSTGGVDAETDDEYQDRGAEQLTFPLRTLARPANFEVYARNYPGVGRALAINNVPGPGHITVFVQNDVDGGTVASKAGLLDDLQELSLLNLVPHVGDGAYTPVNVAFTGVALPGNDPATVNAQAEAAVMRFLDPLLWAQPTQGDAVAWADRSVVRFQDVSHVLNSVEGFDFHTALTVNGVAGDLVLAGPAALPGLDSTVDGTVTAP